MSPLFYIWSTILKIKIKIKNNIYQELRNNTGIELITILTGLGIVYGFHMHKEINIELIKKISIIFIAIFIILSLALRQSFIKSNKKLNRAFSIACLIIPTIIAFNAGILLINNQIKDVKNSPSLSKKYIFIKIKGEVKKIEEFDKRYRVLLDKVEIPRFKKARTPNKLRISISKRHLPISGNDNDNNTKNRDNISIGDKISFYATIYPPNPPIIDGGYNFKEIAFFGKIGGVGYSNKRLKIITKNNSNEFWINVEKLRQTIKENFHKKIDKYNKESASIATALVTGDKSGISTDLRQKYVDSGIAHILAISGLHMALIAGIFFFMIRGLLCFNRTIALDYNTKKIAAAFTIIIVSLYILLCHEAVSAQRSYIMTTTVLIAIIIDRHAITMRNVMIAALIIMLIDPYAIMGISFLLSFSAVIALVAFYNSYYPEVIKFKKDKDNSLILEYIKKILKVILGLIITSLIATVATAPFSLYFFKQLTIVGIVTNIIAIPFVSFIIMPILIITTLSILISNDNIITDFFCKTLSYSLEILSNIADKFSEYKNFIIYIQQPSYSVIFMTSTGFVLLFLFRSNILKKAGLVTFITGLTMLIKSNGPDFYHYTSSSGAKYSGYHDKKKHKLYIAAKRKNKFITKVWQQNAGMPKVEHVKKLSINYSDTLLCDNDSNKEDKV